MKPGRHRHRSRARRLRLKERVRRRFRIRQWRRALLGLSALVGVGLVGAAAVWAIMFFIRAAGPGEAVADVAVEEPLTEPRLIGTWKSDPEATLAELRRTRGITAEEEREARKNCFKTKVTFTDRMIATELDGVVEAQPYQIVSLEGDVVVISSWFALRHQNEDLYIRFVGNDTYWIESQQFGETKSVMECFRRVR
jgi:hypothetical protein